MGLIGAIWGFLGVNALIGFAIYRLAPRAWEAIESDLTTWQWVILIAWTLIMLVSEGYRGFQKKFSPRTAARVRYLRDHPRPFHVLLAPFFCMGYFYATKKTKIVSICLTLGIICLIMLVSLLPTLWRGIVDCGVVAGLAWGIASFWIFTAKALTNPDYPHSPETP